MNVEYPAYVVIRELLIQLLHHLISSNAVVRWTQRCTRVTSRHGAKLVVLRASVVYILAGAQLSLATLYIDPYTTIAETTS